MTNKVNDPEQSYQRLKQSLDEILEQLQHEGTDIDEAVVLHKKGQEILKQLENYLESSAKKAKKE